MHKLHLALATILTFASVLTWNAAAAPADLMTACAPEVSRLCAGVDQGRGRVTACLASHVDKLGSGCLPEVQAVARSRLMPGDARKVFDPGFRADLPRACQAAADSFCPSVATGDGRVFACLYAHTDRVGAACLAEAQATLNQLN